MAGFYDVTNLPNFAVKNPVTQLQQDVRIIKNELVQIQEELGYGQTVSPNILTNIAPQLTSYAFGTTNGVPHKGGFIYGGNFKSNQEFFLGTGTANSAGLEWTKDTVYSWASSGKLLIGLVCSKMIEEGLIKPLDRLFSYDTQFSGTGYYWSTVSATGLTFPTPSGFTGTLAPFSLQAVTISDLIHMNIGLIDDFFTLPAAGILAWTSTYASIAASNNLIALAAAVESYNYFQSLATAGTSAVGFASKIYNGEAQPVSIQTVISNAVTYIKNGTIHALYPPQQKYNSQFPYQTRSLPSTYDTAYILLGYILDKALRANGYTNFSQYVNEKFFVPLEMNHSYILLQDIVPPSDQALSAENSWRRSVAVGAVPFSGAGTAQPFTLANPVTWPSYGCSPAYATGALIALGGGNVAGPLVWDSQYPDDGMSRIGSTFYYYTGSASAYAFGSAPLISSIGDYGKLLKFIGSRGYTPTGKRLLATETWNYFIASKISSLSGLSGFSELDDDTNISQNASFAMGFQRVNRDLSNLTEYGYDETTMFFGGATGNYWYVDYYTGNWMVYGVPEMLLSTGVIDLPLVGSTAGDSVTTQNFLVKMIKE